jgi:hypothetical protein
MVQVLASSATEIISTTVRGKNSQVANGSGQRLARRDVLRRLADRFGQDRLPAAARLISSDFRIGTPLCSRVPSTRQKRATAKLVKIGPSSTASGA